MSECESQLERDVLNYFGRPVQGAQASTVGAGRVVIRRGDQTATVAENDLVNVMTRAGLGQKVGAAVLMTPEIEAMRRAARELRLSVMDGALAKLLRDGRVGTFSLLGPDGKSWTPGRAGATAADTAEKLARDFTEYFAREES